MKTTHLNEHDANQGAQSSGEFLGMTGNSGWYLLGAGGATILLVIILWGVLGVSLLVCLLAGITLCLLAVGYVFTLKNNKPAHYDTDFFESALVESGLLSFCFGPRSRPPLNPFSNAGGALAPHAAKEARPPSRGGSSTSASRIPSILPPTITTADDEPKQKTAEVKAEPMVTRAAFERVSDQLMTMEELLEDALAGREEE